MGVLSREGVARGEGFVGGGVTYFAPGFVARFGDECPSIVHDDAGASQMVSDHVMQSCTFWHSIFPHSNLTRACVIIFGDFTAFFLVVAVDELDRLSVDYGFYALSIAIIRVNWAERFVPVTETRRFSTS